MCEDDLSIKLHCSVFCPIGWIW